MNDAEAHAAIAALEQGAGRGELSPESVCALVSAAARLYTRALERAGEALPALPPDISATDALTLACALLRSQDLTPFEMAVWFSRGQRPT
ncbi:MAG TPA: hypothetical protein VFD69_01485 [Vicinamibacterales bacterium]|nr:hypothetical protein [Vicinamibacterales bacterium]